MYCAAWARLVAHVNGLLPYFTRHLLMVLIMGTPQSTGEVDRLWLGFQAVHWPAVAGGDGAGAGTGAEGVGAGGAGGVIAGGVIAGGVIAGGVIAEAGVETGVVDGGGGGGVEVVECTCVDVVEEDCCKAPTALGLDAAGVA